MNRTKIACIAVCLPLAVCLRNAGRRIALKNYCPIMGAALALQWLDELEVLPARLSKSGCI